MNTKRQGEDYTTGCLLDYEYIKNHCNLITVDLSWQKEVDAYHKNNSTNRIFWTIKKYKCTDADGTQNMFI